MIRLLLLRHAKSAWDDQTLPDIARPLNARGQRAAPLMGRYLRDQGLFADRILCSSSQRTRETLAGLLPFLRRSSEITITESLYRDSEDTYLPEIRARGGTAPTLLLIGHNPAMQETALDCVGTGDRAARDALEDKFPTAALAIVTFDVDDWSAVTSRSGTLKDFVRPRDLEAGEQPPD